MSAFLNNILTAHFALVFVALLICLFGYAVPGFVARAGGNFAWVAWFLACVLCFVVCVKIAFNV
jgi:ABC-type transport system involved in cytochrome c biogenesis permease component